MSTRVNQRVNCQSSHDSVYCLERSAIHCWLLILTVPELIQTKETQLPFYHWTVCKWSLLCVLWLLSLSADCNHYHCNFLRSAALKTTLLQGYDRKITDGFSAHNVPGMETLMSSYQNVIHIHGATSAPNITGERSLREQATADAVVLRAEHLWGKELHLGAKQFFLTEKTIRSLTPFSCQLIKTGNKRKQSTVLYFKVRKFTYEHGNKEW